MWLAITLHPDVLRVEVADGSVATPDRQPAATDGARWSFMLAAALATRWGSGRETGGYLAWFEIDLPAAERLAPTRSAQASPPMISNQTRVGSFVYPQRSVIESTSRRPKCVASGAAGSSIPTP